MNLPIAARLLVTLLLVAAIVTLSIVPGRHQPGDSAFVWLVSVTPTLLQKFLHIVAYATLALLWMWTLERISSVPLRFALVLSITVTMGAVLEWYQTSVPGRFGTLTDVLLNALGSIAGVIAAVFLL